MLWWLLEYCEPKQKKGKKSETKTLFVLNAGLEQVLRALNLELDVKRPDFDIIKSCLRGVYKELYFPNLSGYRSAIEGSGAIQCLAYQFLTPEGAYLSVFLIPPIIAKLQFSIRIHGIYEIEQLITSFPNRTWVQCVYSFHSCYHKH